jgi:hypothetical protein
MSIIPPFELDKVIEEKISESTFRAYHVGFDQNKFRLQPLADKIMDMLVEFAFGYWENQKDISDTTVWRNKLKEAAETVYTTSKYEKRGEFGELILHLLLRGFHNTIPLVSKIYFKDTNNATVHGFDGVHITIEDDSKKLWLGESKFYANGKDGILALVEDLKAHIQEDYLRKEFVFVSRKIPSETPEITHWKNLLNKNTKLDTILNGVCIPLVCTYTSDMFINNTAETEQYIRDFEAECRELKRLFDEKNITTNVDIILMLLPIPNKDELNEELNKRLANMRNI